MNNDNSILRDDLEELKDILRSLKQLLESLPQRAYISKQWLRTEELAEYLSLSPSQIHNLKVKGIISCRKLGGTNYYHREEINNYLKNQENQHE